jgi:mercuric ion transport protein
MASKRLIGGGIVASVLASLCCITPLMALLAGTSGLAFSFGWLDAYRPYLIGLTVVLLGYAWYQKIRLEKQMACNCATETKPNFMQTRFFLGIVTALAFLMLAFPNYAKVFYPTAQKQVAPGIVQAKANTQTVEYKISGMTCDACTLHVANEVNKVAGILDLNVSYANGNALVAFDKSKTNAQAVQKAINATGYKVTATNITK